MRDLMLGQVIGYLVRFTKLPVALSSYLFAIIGCLAMVFDLADQAVINPQFGDLPIKGNGAHVWGQFWALTTAIKASTDAAPVIAASSRSHSATTSAR